MTDSLPAFDILFSVPDLPVLLFTGLDPSSLALAACVCKKWRDLARRVRGSRSTAFQLSFKALVHSRATLAWAIDNLGEKLLPPKLRDKACAIAAQEGALEALQWALENGCVWRQDTCARAARKGHLAVLQWAREHDCPWDADICAWAASGGHLKILRWAHGNGCDWDKADCLRRAKQNKHETVAAWIEVQPE
jgi:hypothetical protein